jgi:hypothetical protein
MPVSNLSRRGVLLAGAATAGLALTAPGLALAADRSAILATMKRATRFMVEEASVGGGYVWSGPARLLAPLGRAGSGADHDLGPASGHGDHGPPVPRRVSRHRRRGLLHRRRQRRRALVRGQHPSGGWNYVIDTAGEASLRRWYDTSARTPGGWRNSSTTTATPPSTTRARPRRPSSCCGSIWRSASASGGRRWTRRSASSSTASIANGGWPQRYPRVPDGGPARPRRLHRLHHLQRRRRGREHQIPDLLLSDAGRPPPAGSDPARDGLLPRPASSPRPRPAGPAAHRRHAKARRRPHL